MSVDIRVSTSDIMEEVDRAESLHGSIPSAVRGMVILMEEVGEASERILEMSRPCPKESKDARAKDAIEELVQVVSTAWRIAELIAGGVRE